MLVLEMCMFLMSLCRGVCVCVCVCVFITGPVYVFGYVCGVFQFYTVSEASTITVEKMNPIHLDN